MDINSVFFELIQIALQLREKFTVRVDAEMWKELYQVAVKQRLEGISFMGIQNLRKKKSPEVDLLPRPLFLQWMPVAVNIQRNNETANAACQEVVSFFTAAGFVPIILKGQHNAEYYSELLKPARTPGDIDVWLLPNKSLSLEERRKYIVEYARANNQGKGTVSYHHIDFQLKEVPIPIEVHYTPSYLANPIYNNRFQKWFDGFDHNASCLQNERERVIFDSISVLSHIFRHYIEEGVGLRQLLDYYFVLLKIKDNSASAETIALLKQFGLLKFASAVMWFMKDAFAMSDAYLLCAPNERLGKKIKEQVIIGGNFGRHDSRVSQLYDSKNKFVRFVKRESFYLRYVFDYPNETLCLPLFQLRRWKLRKM